MLQEQLAMLMDKYYSRRPSEVLVIQHRPPTINTITKDSVAQHLIALVKLEQGSGSDICILTSSYIRTTNPSVPTWSTNVQTESFAYFLSDKNDTQVNRILSLSIQQIGSITKLNLFQRDGSAQGPTMTYVMSTSENTQFVNKWNFMWVAYDFMMLNYVVNIYPESSNTPFLQLNSQCSGPVTTFLTFCQTGQLVRPFLRRPNMKLQAGLSGPMGNTFRGQQICGMMAGFQWYPGIMQIDPRNIWSIKYGFNQQGRYLNYRMDTIGSTLVVHDYSSEGKHAILDSVGSSWDTTEKALKITAETRIIIPSFRFSEDLYSYFNKGGKFTISLWFKASAGIPLFSLVRRINNAILVFDYRIEWQSVTQNYFLKYSNDSSFFNLAVVLLPDTWHQIISVFDNYLFSTNQTYQTSQVVTLFINDSPPQTFITTTVPPFTSGDDQDVVQIGSSETLPASSSIFLASFQIHQGSRVIIHNYNDDYDPACYVSIVHNRTKFCLRCTPGYLMVEEGTTTRCVPSDQCTQVQSTWMSPSTTRRYCLRRCAPSCKNCSAVSPSVCTSCINNLILLPSGQCNCSTGYFGYQYSTLQCSTLQNVGNTITGEYTFTDFQNIGNASAQAPRSQSVPITFPQAFTSPPRVILTILAITQTGNQFFIQSTSPLLTQFNIKVNAIGSTVITALTVKYFASSETSHYQMGAISLAAQNLQNGTGFRSDISILKYVPWNQMYGQPLLKAFLIGWNRTGGTGNMTLKNSYNYKQNSVEMQTQTEGDNTFQNIYWTYVLMPQYSQHFTIINNHTINPIWTALSPNPLSGSQRFNVSTINFNLSQSLDALMVYGLTQISVNAQTNITISIQRQSSNRYSLQFNAFQTSIVGLYGVEGFSLVTNCTAMGCQTCSSSPQKCITCADTSRTPALSCLDCTPSEFIDSRYRCGACSNACVGCSGSRTGCLACPQNANRVSDIANSCPCNSNYFDNGGATCLACDYKCESCSMTATNCTACSGSNRNLENNCLCKDQFYNRNQEPICLPCVAPCQTCNISGCITCQGNRNVTAQLTCDCPAGGSEIKDSWFCNTCTDIPVTVTLATSLDYLSVDFPDGQPVQYSSINYVNMSPQDVCKSLIDTKTYQLLGDGPRCVLNTDGSRLTIKFGKGPTVMKGDLINMNGAILQQLKCTKPIQNFFFVDVKYPSQFLAPHFTISGPTVDTSICSPITLKITNLKNDGFRTGLLTNWDYGFQITDLTLKNNLDIILQQVNQVNQANITFPAGILNGYQTYVFMANFTSYMNLTYNTTFTFKTLGRVQPYLNVMATPIIEQNYKMKLLIPSSSYFTMCQSGQTLVYTTNLTLTWSEVNRVPNNSDPFLPAPVLMDIPPGLNYLEVPPNTGQVDTTYTLQAQLRYNDTDNQGNARPIFVDAYVDVRLIYLGIGVSILGGERIVSANEDITFQVLTWDPLDPLSYPLKSDDSINITWSCTKRSKPCTDKNNKPIFLSGRKQTIKAGTFPEGTAFQINVTASKGRRVSTFSVVVNIVTYSIPVLNVTYPITLHSRKVLIDEMLHFKIEVDGDPQDYTYSYSIVYNDAPQATIPLAYPYASFKLIYFLPRGIQSEDVSVQLIAKKITETVPQASLLPVIINSPPQGASLYIIPSSGTAITDYINITVNGARDADQPLQYSLSVYPAYDSYLDDIYNGRNINQLLLVPFQIQNNFSVVLPSSRYINGLTASECFIVVTILDAKGASSNLTQLLTITRNHYLYQQYMVTITSFAASLYKSNTTQMVIAAGLETLYFYQAMRNRNQDISDILQPLNDQYERILKEANKTKDVAVRSTLIKILNMYLASGFVIQSAPYQAQNNLFLTNLIGWKQQLDQYGQLLGKQIPLLWDLLGKGDKSGQENVENAFWFLRSGKSNFYPNSSHLI